ncbi:MAG: TIGR04255 family protein [Candidatus Obscuribacterales bacterium]|nr:TIGR04255 family protein [Candidatus Obscuribacterales bacterium]
MKLTADNLPSYKHPPVVEVVLSSQFAAIERLTAAHLGLLWEKFRGEFPETEQHPPAPHQVETFGQLRSLRNELSMRLINEFPIPRFWFKDQNGNQLVQVQSDRFMHNWRKKEECDNYPRYPEIRRKFIDELRLFEKFLSSEKLGSLVFDQCEITYFNHIVPLSHPSKSTPNPEDVVTFLSNVIGKELNCVPDDVKSVQKFPITENGAQIGRLHIEFQSGVRLTDNIPIFILNLTARMAPRESTIDGVLERLDLGRIWIIKAFQACSTETMRVAWGEYYEPDN